MLDRKLATRLPTRPKVRQKSSSENGYNRTGTVSTRPPQLAMAGLLSSSERTLLTSLSHHRCGCGSGRRCRVALRAMLFAGLLPKAKSEEARR